MGRGHDPFLSAACSEGFRINPTNIMEAQAAVKRFLFTQPEAAKEFGNRQRAFRKLKHTAPSRPGLWERRPAAFRLHLQQRQHILEAIGKASPCLRPRAALCSAVRRIVRGSEECVPADVARVPIAYISELPLPHR